MKNVSYEIIIKMSTQFLNHHDGMKSTFYYTSTQVQYVYSS